MTEIKPCPFCGGEAHFETSFSGGPYVLCDECGAATMFADDEDGAAAFWHRRTPDPSLLNGLREARQVLANILSDEEVALSRPDYRDAHDTIAKLDTLLSQEGGQ